MQNIIKDQIRDSIYLTEKVLNDPIIIVGIEKSIQMILSTFRNKGKILLAGNGGSAADAQHFAAEFVNKFYFDRPGLPAIALTTDSSIITAIANDSDFGKLFSRQIEAIGNHGDLFIAFSTSGNSLNILNALDTCKNKGIQTIGFTGNSNSPMYNKCNICLAVPSGETPRIQELHTLFGHIVCYCVEHDLFKHLG